jgi:poly-gamma-glutamate system protein
VKKNEILLSVKIILLALGGILLAVFVRGGLPRQSLPYRDLMIRAETLMRECCALVLTEREALGLGLDPIADPGGTGLIGLDYSEITTSTGSLEAKRTVAQAPFAALLVRLYHEAGLKPGDDLVLLASGSFPGAVIAALCAAEVMDLRVSAVFSLGASNWGANIPEFTLLEMYALLGDRFPRVQAAFSLGGARDAGGDMSEEGRDYLLAKLKNSGEAFIHAPDLNQAVQQRLVRFFPERAEDSGTADDTGGFFPRAAVNIGGADANIGNTLEALQLVPGLNTQNVFSSAAAGTDIGAAGLLLRRGLPLIHLLNIRTLALQYGLPYDPVTPAGEAKVLSTLYRIPSSPLHRRVEIFLFLGYTGFCLFVLRKKK